MNFIAGLGDGSFRDTLSHLQKVFSHFDADISFTELETIFSGSKSVNEYNLLKSLIVKDHDLAMKTYHSCMSDGGDVQQLLDRLLEKSRKALLIKTSKVFQEHYSEQLSSDEAKQLSELTVTPQLVSQLLNISVGMQKTQNKDIVFELGLLKLLAD